MRRVSCERGGMWRFGWAWAGRPAKAALKRRSPGTLARVFEGSGVCEDGGRCSLLNLRCLNGNKLSRMRHK